MGPMRGRQTVGTLHEPPPSRPSAPPSPPCGERAGRGVPIWFMVPMRAQKRKEAFHEPESGLPAIQRFTQTRFMAPTHVRILEVFPLHEARGTSNIEHPTPNIEWQARILDHF